MNRNNLSLCAGLLSVVAVQGVYADGVNVPEMNDHQNIDVFVSANTVLTCFQEVSPNRWVIEAHQKNPGGGLVVVSGFDMNDIVERITINYRSGIGTNNMLLNISTGDQPTSIGAIEKIEYASNVNLDVSLINTLGDIGLPAGTNLIQARNIRNMIIGGDVYSQIVLGANGATSSPSHVKVFGDWISGSYVNNNPTDLAFLRVDGSVGSVRNAVDFWSEGLIEEITVGGNFNGRIGNNGEGFSGHPDIEFVEVGGNFNGSSPMTMNSLDALTIGGDFDANLTVSSAMLATSVYNIGGTFTATASLSLPTDGLVGQGIVNSSNTSADWLGNVTVGGVPLTKDYTALSAQLGGGAIGLAPYNFHQREAAPPQGVSRDCNPFHTEQVSIDPVTSLNQVTISHYGPVYITGPGPHFRIEFRSDLAVLPNPSA